jgi:DNA/RNA endonuclease G (NUC1)
MILTEKNTNKRLFISWVLLITVVFAANAQQVKIVYPGYTCYWNSKSLIPDSVIYVAKPHVKAADRVAKFHATGGRLNEDRDYAHSGYDQGHLCNASDENGSKIDEANSFDQCNIFPQTPNCNRITWLGLENYIRKLATKYGSVKVKVYWHGIAGYMGIDKVTIPAFCDKEIWYNGIHEKYSMPNTNTVNANLFTYYKLKN